MGAAPEGPTSMGPTRSCGPGGLPGGEPQGQDARAGSSAPRAGPAKAEHRGTKCFLEDSGKVGFEPTALAHDGFQNRYFKPLSHLPQCSSGARNSVFIYFFLLPDPCR